MHSIFLLVSVRFACLKLDNRIFSGASGLPIASRPSCVGTKGPTDGGLPVDRNPSVKGIQIPTYMEHSVQVVPIKTEYNGKPCLPGVMVFQFGGAKVMTENVSFKSYFHIIVCFDFVTLQLLVANRS
jgi:hypothetical protein